jgi:RimJ/RimL family protein N-acetyltransferase
MFRPVDAIQERDWFLHYDRSPTPMDMVLGVVVHEGERLIGTVGIHHISWVNRVGEIGILLGDKENWGRGFGYDALSLLIDWAFRSLDLHRVDSRVLSGNVRSERLMRKLGFVEEGRARSKYYRDGARQDEIIFGMLRDEWKGV